jgi:hypothetical protein
MGLKSALGRLKKIAEHVDAPTTKIDDWVWRPLSDFHRDTGYIEEVPAYIQDNFGRFMQEQAERARRGEMGPRDLLKAYGITRSSVMRTGRKLDDVERLGLKIYDPEPGLIRPEGAFSSWLLSPAGQKYLDLAEQGVADTDSIEDIRRKFRVFGMQNMLADDLRYAAENLAPKGYELNEMLFAPIDEWRGFTEGIKGVSSGKSGFPASMLGRGDIGTFDAREIKGHIGMSSEDAGKYMSRSRQGRPIGGYEAVDRMGDRQRAMDVRIEPDLEPYYQHLVHHGNWDALEGDQTTHNDLIRALRHAAVVTPVAGGAALYQPESEEPEEYARGGLVGGLENLVKKYLKVYHGSPHVFPPTERNPLGEFDLSKIGTGEGSQAYGHGAYTAEDMEVAKQYAKKLSHKAMREKFLEALPKDAEHDELLDLLGTGHFSEPQEGLIKALHADDWLGFDYPSQAISAAYRDLHNYDPSDELRNAVNATGKLYTVELPEDKVIQMLDWDKPLGVQSEAVKDFMGSTGLASYDKNLDKWLSAGRTNVLNSGEDFYNYLRGPLKHFDKPGWRESAERVRQDFQEAGIPGIKYLDGNSRNAGEGSRNFVIFDPSITNIVDRKAKGGLVGLAEKYLPRMMSIFSGGGTLEHGLEGLAKPVMAVEKDPEIAQHYANLFGKHIVNADVQDVDFSPMAGKVDLLHASPSCKNYSSANCKTEDPIDLMTADATARAIRDIRPPIFTLENVPAYQKRGAFQRIADELNEQGYNWDIVRHNAADLGAPSNRNRMMVRAMLDADLPPAQQYWPKPGDWFPAIEDQLESMRPSQLAPWQLRRLAERGIDPASLDTPLLVGGGSGFKGDIPLAFAGKPGITVLSSPVQTDRVVLPGGDVRALNPRSYARLLGLSDSYPLPDDRSLAKIIVGNGMAPAMTREVVEPLLNQRLINMVEKYK